MLYISRILQHERYGVVDSDDDTETIVTKRALLNYCGYLGLEIDGVVVRRSIGAPELYHVFVSHGPGVVSMKQIKAMTLLGVDIIIRKDEIVAINGDASKASKNVVIRLSDYASKLFGNVMIAWKSTEYCRVLRIVFDDRIEIVDKLGKLDYHCVQYDLREVSDDQVANSIYTAIVRSRAFTHGELDRVVLDISERAILWRSVEAVYDKPAEVSFLSDIRNSPDKARISEFVASHFRQEFRELCTQSIKASSFFCSSNTFREMLQTYMLSDWGLLKGCRDYDLLRRSFYGVIPMLRNLSVLNSSSLLHLQNFMSIFDVPDWLKCLYVTLCASSIDAIEEFIRWVNKT